MAAVPDTRAVEYWLNRPDFAKEVDEAISTAQTCLGENLRGNLNYGCPVGGIHKVILAPPRLLGDMQVTRAHFCEWFPEVPPGGRWAVAVGNVACAMSTVHVNVDAIDNLRAPSVNLDCTYGVPLSKVNGQPGVGRLLRRSNRTKIAVD